MLMSGLLDPYNFRSPLHSAISTFLSACMKQTLSGRPGMMEAEVAQFFPRAAGGGGRDAAPPPGGQALGPCPRCHSLLLLCRRDGEVPFVMCSGAPACRERVYLPCGTTAAEPAEATCGVCQHGVLRKLALTCAIARSCLHGVMSPRQDRRGSSVTCHRT